MKNEDVTKVFIRFLKERNLYHKYMKNVSNTKYSDNEWIYWNKAFEEVFVKPRISSLRRPLLSFSWDDFTFKQASDWRKIENEWAELLAKIYRIKCKDYRKKNYKKK